MVRTLFTSSTSVRSPISSLIITENCTLAHAIYQVIGILTDVVFMKHPASSDGRVLGSQTSPHVDFRE